MTKKKEEETGRPSPEQIEAWKKEHKELFELETEDGHRAILRKPTMFDLERALMVDRKKGAKPFDFNKNLADNCLLWSTAGFFEDDARILALHGFAGELSAAAEVRTRKL